MVLCGVVAWVFFVLECHLLRLKLCPRNVLNFLEIPEEEGGSSCAPGGLG